MLIFKIFNSKYYMAFFPCCFEISINKHSTFKNIHRVQSINTTSSFLQVSNDFSP